MSLTTSAIHDRAANKAFAAMTMLNIRLKENERDLRTENYGGDISRSEYMMIVESNQKELKVWQHIAELIEKSNKL